MDTPVLHPLLSTRRSTRAFDPDAEVSDAELAVLLEAARWAPSSWNAQPWRFLVGLRDSDVHKRIFGHLAAHNQRWAGRASALLAAGYLTRAADGGPLPHAAYDLGQAVAHLSVQASALGLWVHQMAGFDAAGLHAEFGLPDDLALLVVVAVGRLGDPSGLPEDLWARESAPRERRPVSDLLLP